MEEKALRRVITSGRLANNAFSCDWKVVTDNFGMTRTAVCRFLLNGREHEAQCEIDDSRMADKRAIAEKICEAVVRVVAQQITLPLFMSGTIQQALR